jgi:hypothetical protein
MRLNTVTILLCSSFGRHPRPQTVIPAKAGIQENVEINTLSMLNNQNYNISPIFEKLFFIKWLMDPRLRGDDKQELSLVNNGPLKKR